LDSGTGEKLRGRGNRPRVNCNAKPKGESAADQWRFSFTAPAKAAPILLFGF
jgi:hypothetical protein